MQTLKLIKPYLALFLITSFFMASSPVFAETASTGDTPSDHKNLNLSGLYLGYYPCSDCQGIRTTLALNKNNSYVYISLYAGKSDREIIEKGKFSFGNDGKTLVLTPKKRLHHDPAILY